MCTEIFTDDLFTIDGSGSNRRELRKADYHRPSVLCTGGLGGRWSHYRSLYQNDRIDSPGFGLRPDELLDHKFGL